MDFRLDFSLQRSALISWSGWFWNRPDIKEKIKDIIDHGDLENLHHKESFRDLVEVAKGYLKAVTTPKRLYDRLVETIIALGLRAVHWHYSTSREYKSIPFGYTRALHWTVFGTVDEAKIVKNCLIEKLETLQNDELICDIYYMACGSILKDFINSNAEKMLNKAESFRSRAVFNEKWYFIVCSVLTLASPEDVSEEKKIELISKYFAGLTDRKEAYMFSMSVRKGHVIAARYYWQQLSSLEREKKFIEAADICLRPINPFLKVPRPIRFTDVLVFLLSEVLEKGMKQFFVTERNRLQFLGFRIRILNSLIRSYGWENHFFSVFNLLRSEMTKCSEYYCVLQCIIDTLQERRLMGFDAKNTIYHQMLSVVLSNSNFEVDRIFYSNNNSKFVPKVFELFDLDVINMILEKYSDRRIDFLKNGEIQYEKLIRDKRFNLLGEFMETVLRSEDEREWFRRCQIGYLYDFIREDAFHLADNLLHVLGSSEEERKRIKRKIDFLSFTAEYFSKGDLKFAEKILNWGFSDDKEEIEYFNTFWRPAFIHLKNITPMSDFLLLFWKKDEDKNHFILSLSEFLNWFFGCENDNYKISKIFSEKLLRNIFKAIYKIEVEDKQKCLFVGEAFNIIDELMKLYVPLEDVAKLKAEVAEIACKWLTECIILSSRFGGNCWGLLNFFLDWVLEVREGNLDYETKKREFVKNLLLTRDGLKLFRLIVCWCLDVQDYLCLWIEWAGGISKIENLLDEMGLLSKNIRYFQENFQCLKQLCEERFAPRATVKHTCL